MYNIRLSSYVPEPEPAHSDRIIAAHYYAAWKKGAARIHNAFDDLHDYPERTPLCGYYDEENPEYCDWEIKWAVEHGINCFIHCWYRNLENTGKPVTENDLRCGHAIHEALFNARYKNYMKFAIMFENSKRWGTSDPVDIVDNLMPFWTENYFKKENYLVIDKKPVLFVYQPTRLLESMGGPEAQKKAFDACREYAVKEGFDGMTFATFNYDVSDAGMKTDYDSGYDFRFCYHSCYHPPYDYPPQQDVIDGQLDILRRKLAQDPMGFVPTPSCFLDNTPRRSQRWFDMGYNYRNAYNYCYKLDAENFRIILREMKKMTDALPDGAWGKKIFMIDNWNEWDEGHYVAPSHEFGFQYLQAIREELTFRDNLPDYRMPQDIGLSNFNKSWGSPDFSDICRKKFGVDCD